MPKLVKSKVARRMVVASFIAIGIGVGIGPYFLQMAGLPIEALGAVGGVAFSVEGYLMFRAKYKPEPEPELSRRERVRAFASGKFNSLVGLLRAAPVQEQPEPEPTPRWKLKFRGGSEIVEQVQPAPGRGKLRKNQPVQKQQVQEPSAQQVAELLTWAAVPMAFPFIGEPA
ncbi:hypothetical protein KSX_44340 [Ktedonospora formicarum]|uniref:Uncharacterized protein n=2 Tax=Ktedonospora formicarum TaxID=2778364 RepID=A0A8J3MTU1_9CHLR|nr:hypothetical protein KSX_44340 [Ktedonospora formicarum]